MELAYPIPIESGASLTKVFSLAVLIAAVVLVATAVQSASLIVGTAVVKDGDYLIVGAAHVRLYGIDAFERAQVCGDPPWACGEAARDRLVALTDGREVACEPRTEDRWGRTVAICRVAEDDLGAALVREGLAVAFRRVAFDYEDEEAVARATKAGAWSGAFTFPWDFRREAF
jgi:endonuclease YncB( thermonuclease family)